MGARLVFNKGPLSGTELVLEEGSVWSLGRDADKNDIDLKDEKLAPSQLKIALIDGQYTITNLDPAFPVILNDERIEEPKILSDGMRLVFGSCQCVFYTQAYANDDTVYEFSLSSDAKADASLFSASHSEGQSAQSANVDQVGRTQPTGVSDELTHQENQKPQTVEQKDQATSSPELTDKDHELAQSFLNHVQQDDSPAQHANIDIAVQDQQSQANVSEQAKEALQEPVSTTEVNEAKSTEVSEAKSVVEDDQTKSQLTDPAKSNQESSSSSKQTPIVENSELQASEPTKEDAQPEEAEKVSNEDSQDQSSSEQPEHEEGEHIDSVKDEETTDQEENQEKKVEEEVVEPQKEEEGDTASENHQTVATDSEDLSKKHTDEDGIENEESEGENVEADAEDQQSEDHAKKEADSLVPFDVQDLFRFDQSIFPVDIENVEHKHIEADLSQPSRFLLKVLAGANIGAEFHLDSGKTYILGSDANTADIVFNDTSVSHQHAKIIVGNDNTVMVEDLGSKNGVIVEGRKIEHSSTLSANQVVALGTTLFLLVDHTAPANTIVATFAPEDYGLFGRPRDEEALARQAIEEEEAQRKRATLPTGSFILTLFIGGLAVLFGIGTASLFHTKEIVPIETVDAEADLDRIVQEFPSVRYTFNRGNGQLFLIGHVKNSIDKSELLYKVDSLPFVRAVDDNVINDEAVWQEMNILLSKRPEFKGVSMHSPEPGKFVISGYLKTENQAACLSEYLNLHFNYLSLLENKVVVETYLFKTVTGELLQAGFANIQVSFANGEMILTGYINQENAEKFQSVLESLSQISGVRMIKNFVVILPVEEGIIDLNLRYPRRYRVTGYSKYGDVSINVVINGRILTRGDVLDGMTITSIQPNCIFLEKDGLKYKIEYNK